MTTLQATTDEEFVMRYSLLLPLGLLGLTGCVVDTPAPVRTTTTYVTPAPAPATTTTTYVTPPPAQAYMPPVTYVAPPPPATTTVVRTPY